MTKETDILEKHLPTLEKDVEGLKQKDLTPKVAETVSQKADKILAQNFSGKKLEKLRKQLAKTMKDLQKNRRVK